jgi:hypothetical protein
MSFWKLGPAIGVGWLRNSSGGSGQGRTKTVGPANTMFGHRYG